MKHVIPVIIAIVTAAFMASCDGKGTQAPASGDSTCENKASRGALDEACVIEIAKAAILKQVKGVQYSKYTVRFDSQDHHWVVMAYDENGPPDSHTFVLIGPTGTVEDVHQGI
jgi:hypothetical protein